ncbi:CsgG/HfaB family protein [Christiangramia sp. OXR-203]|jgi:curli production assembly/transport component CsgG|uniref:CsgG/HfaB family protein n=1 Tax=Christiangramia sp. OXR-203 TaxID=3100176 RepID=UPI002AC97183|nr:CsgG/HfaB family protein [Christiangramia sp. OXR-203]WPY97978.1 CsgG/HfaB family protein [Christiangramia sp. OXR-203]
MNIKNLCLIGLSSLLCLSCSTYLNQPVDFREARIGENTSTTEKLKTLPEPAEKVVVGVYNFRDLTGQYKASQSGSTFSTAVTQGGTAILINALENSGWFTTIERENIGNLLNERNIIRSTRQEYQGAQDNEPQVPPLLFAGVLLEGGIVSYDTNIITGGMGARYFGIGGSTQYRQDRVTVYLRAISTSSGKILKNIYVSKTILSQSLDASLFKYVKFQRLLEAEVGVTRNEPVQLAVTEAIEKAVEGLIIEGVEDNLWKVKDGQDQDVLIQAYRQEKQEADLESVYGGKLVQRTYSSSLTVNLGGSLISGDFNSPELGPLVKVDFSQYLNNSFYINLGANAFELSNNPHFSQKYTGVDANAGFLVLPNEDLSPFVQAGAGYLFSIDSNAPDGNDTSFFKAQYGLGLEYLLSPKVSLKAFAEHNITFSDQLDFVINGNRDDHYFNFSVGVSFNLGAMPSTKSN